MAEKMNNTWEYKSLSELGFIGRGKSKHRPRNDSSLYGGQYPFIQTADIKHANFYVNSFSQTYNEAGLKQSKLWGKDTLCMTIAANIAESAILSFPACFPDSVVGFIANPKKANVKFVKYALDCAKKSFQKTATGTAQDNLSLEKIDTIKIRIPDVETQNRIASVLSAYDDLIENNEKRIKALEEMAQLLYTEWFIKFKYPGHEKVKLIDTHTEFGKIPEGWELVRINDILQTVKRKPKLTTGEYQKSGCYPIVDQGRDFIAGYTDDENTVYNQDLIVFGDHSRCFKYCNFPFACGADGTQLLLTNDRERMPQTLLYYSVINSGLKNYDYARHFKFLKALIILKPDGVIANIFSREIDESYKQITILRKQNNVTSILRDHLISHMIANKIGGIE